MGGYLALAFAAMREVWRKEIAGSGNKAMELFQMNARELKSRCYDYDAKTHSEFMNHWLNVFRLKRGEMLQHIDKPYYAYLDGYISAIADIIGFPRYRKLPDE